MVRGVRPLPAPSRAKEASLGEGRRGSVLPTVPGLPTGSHLWLSHAEEPPFPPAMHQPLHRWSLLLLGSVLLHGLPASAQPAGGASSNSQAPVSARWPRTFTKDGSSIVVYEPQVDAWKDHTQIKFRCAVAVTPSGATQPIYGVVAAQADTAVHSEAGTVVMSNIQPAVHFPGMAPEQAAPLQALVLELLPSLSNVQVPLSTVIAFTHDTPQPRPVPVNLAPPPIWHSDSPAILVMFLGQPSFKPVAGTNLMVAVNTNWALFLDSGSQRYYLLDDKSWLTTTDVLKGPWTAATQLPASFNALQASQWPDVAANLPGQPFSTVPTVYTSTQPADLIVTDGPPNYAPIDGTGLMYVNNPVQPVFFDLPSNTMYYLSAGRWFSAPTIDGPWSAASSSLPADFSRIPPSSPVGFVLASVPGTSQAKDAVLLAQVPHKATLNTADLSLNVAYVGQPQFEPIQGTSMQYATNTSYQVVNVGGTYYCCNKAVWFQAPSPTGPWAVCTSVPSVIYTIPPSNPLYNVTYVQVYGATPTTVTVGYTGGYSGEYVAATGALMFGAGMLTGALIASNNWYSYPPCYWSYGCGAYYHGYYGGYVAGGAWYGPYAHGAWGASYNPATGTFTRGGYVAGPYGSASYHQAYNPWTGGYGAHASGTTGYGHWGASTVSQGGQWASAAHATGPAGVTRGGAVDSSGQWAEGAHAGDSTVARTSGGDVYAGHDGNVYRNQDGQWQKYDGGSWNNVNKPTTPAGSSAAANAAAPRTPSQASAAQDQWRNNWNSDQSRSNWQDSMAQRQQGGGQDAWNHSDTQAGLNRDQWARSNGGEGGGGANGSGWGSRGGSFNDGGSWNRGFNGGGGWGDRSGGFRSAGGWGGGGGFRGRR